MNDAGQRPRRGIGHSTNLVGRPSEWLASCAFNDAAVPLHIWGVVEMNPSLFTMLAQADDLAEAGEAFSSYMMAMFGLDPEQHAAASAGQRRFRSSFLRLIQGWSFDSNGPEGAVLKGWVESRFGLCPSFHKEIIEHVASRAWTTYVEEKMSSRFHNNAIWVQLDLLFEFCQWAIRRFVCPGETHLTLYRGVNAFDEHWIVDRTARREAVIRLNNLVSFSSDRDTAGCFGDTILTARIPVSKILFFNSLLSSHALKGEGEYLVIGGEYRVSVDYV
ncbi:NAD(+)--dinitrogen-reductase ADP-D-ribosyltransferase [Bradyrhizobium ontarionense]|uniref:NAD(+)--dinitrogen-reductase ADP-D-ribosyltransferase n=1 Tax=Bradyrhizobium ontarionense TaxID=2898149 RepID=A0ABY3RNX5_9BRAD|nr:NAD(+)--dinitrogen-reductase ADP-D-ribosyltransferase [Bradyrhizobium sp. A19]UFZ08427.1 NAD(+)--dinitrogen-reductase ADP-D-ribosyltransferase [Bradyrhizobium sp. A19]